MTQQAVKKELARAARELKELLDRAAGQISSGESRELEQWRHLCENCRQRLEEDLLRMAVVGTIKSGKSTFINSLFSGDYLKRGAGVITSIVTRVRRSDLLEAVVYFKSWEEINSEIRQSLNLFPSAGWRSSAEPFDIRNQSDRRDLRQALTSLETGYLVNRDSRSVSSVLLDSYLQGYDKVAGIVSDQTETRSYTGRNFHEHQAFAGDQALAVYLKDLELFIDSGDMAENIEIADCQGSDSPNPLHLAMIQDYLHTSDLIIYLISSRTGIRQADLKFMSMIKQMGAMGNVLFVINCDFNEHENLDDLKRVRDQVRQDLALLTPSPAVYTFSSLYALFLDIRDFLTEKDRARLDQWRGDQALAQFSQKEKTRFEADFNHLITEHRYMLLLKNQLQRMETVSSDFAQWLAFNQKVFSSDASGADALVSQIREQQKKTEKIRSMINSTFDGACRQLKKELKTNTDRFFDLRHGQVVPAVVDFIRSYHISPDQYRAMLSENGLSETLLVVFQDFKDRLDVFMAEQINPRLFGFVAENEAYAFEYLESICRPYESMIRETLADFGQHGGPGQENSDRQSVGKPAPVSIDGVKKAHGIAMPNAAATFDYTRGIQTEAFMKLGFFRMVQGIKKLVNRSGSAGNADFSALESGVARMKQETEATVVFHFKNYRENLKFQYLFLLIDAVAGEMSQWLIQRFQTYATDLNRIREIGNRSQEEKKHSLAEMAEMISELERIKGQVNSLEKSLGRQSPGGGGAGTGDKDP
ncbi:MAG: dynamin family protein [Desulfosalsimonas sp.]|uniref:dynamin family protein n=1 Tax=Desulfosalsimonas sp. TaxID=3073848 RepID=UPI0039711317